MGVTNLWTILAPVKKHKTLAELKGQVLAVDLSIWVCENQSVKQMHGVVVKPHLRNLFFRVSYLTQLGVKLVFVIEGEAPELKWEEMWRRQQARGLVKPGTTFKNVKRKRSQFASCLKECCELLDLLGIPHITGHGEAESMCAALNAAGLVDGCLTDDGDAFLYGARTVYRNFTMNSKDPHVESYCMSDIENDLGINRQSLVGLSLLLGCDYIPGGVAGVGVANAVKLLKSLAGMDVIQRFKEWKKMSKSDCLDKIEMSIREKSLKIPEFPQQQVVDEFLISKERIPKKPFLWKKANISSSQEFGTRKLEWPVEYTLEKVLPLVTLWSMLDKKQNGSSSKQLTPFRIVKSRVRHFIPSYEVEWNKDVWDKTSTCEYYTTIEEQGLFTECYPLLVSDYNTNLELTKKNKKKAPKKKPKKDSEMDDLASKLESTSLDKDSLTISLITGTEKSLIPGTKLLHTEIETAKNLVSVKPKSNKPIGSKHQTTSKMAAIKKESETKVTTVTNDSDTMDIEDEVFVPLSVRIKQKLNKEKNKGDNHCTDRLPVTKDTDACIDNKLPIMSDANRPTLESSLEVASSVKRKPVSCSSSNSRNGNIESNTVAKPDLQKDINIHLDSAPVSTSCDVNKVEKIYSRSETSSNLTAGSVKPQKVVCCSMSDLKSSSILSEGKHKQSVTDGVKLKTMSVSELSGKTSKTKKLKLKKRIKSVKKDVLLLDDSVTDFVFDSENQVISQTKEVLHDRTSNMKYTSLKKRDDELNKENENISDVTCRNLKVVPQKSDINEIVDNILTESFQNMSVAKENSPPMSNQDMISSPCVNNLAKRLLYSAVKKGCRNISTPCHNFLSPHQLETPHSIGLNRTADLDFGNFKIQTSLLNSLLQVSNMESPVNNVFNSSTDLIGSAVKSDLNTDQSPTLFEIDSEIKDLGRNKKVMMNSASFSPVIPIIQNDIKMLLDFEQSPGETLKPCEPSIPVISLIPNITKPETTYCSPAPLSLKDRLKLRLKDSKSQVLQDLSNL